MGYQAEHRKSIENPEDFWGKQAEEIDWFEFPKTILSQDSNQSYRWFEGGKLNTSYRRWIITSIQEELSKLP